MSACQTAMVTKTLFTANHQSTFSLLDNWWIYVKFHLLHVSNFYLSGDCQ